VLSPGRIRSSLAMRAGGSTFSALRENSYEYRCDA
jgi:hypothetical protein